MLDKKSNVKSIRNLLQTNGFLFPTTSEEVEQVENIYRKEIKKEKPLDWENPINILNRGKQKTKQINLPKYNLTTEAENLSMVAREGKQITDSVRKRMNEDRKNAEQK